MPRAKPIRVSAKLRTPMSETAQKHYHGQLMAMFDILPKVSEEFGVKKPDIEFKFTGDRNGHYNWHTQTIYISPKPWSGSPMSIFIHEFAHHVQWTVGRTAREFLAENKEHTPEGGHGWSFYEILKLVVDHFEFVHDIPYDWTSEYTHIRAFHQEMNREPGYVSETKISAVVNLMGCSRDEARRLIQEQEAKHVSA